MAGTAEEALAAPRQLWRPGARHAAAALASGAVAVACGSAAVRLLQLREARRRLQELLAAAAGSDARVVVTGADSGIGAELAQQLSRHSAVSLLLGCRDVGAARERWESGPGARRLAHLELLDLDSVERFADEAHRFLLSGGDGLRLLVNAAGIVAPVVQRSSLGIGVTMQTNFVGPFLLTELLARWRETEKASLPLRVVLVASGREVKSILRSPEMPEEELQQQHDDDLLESVVREGDDSPRARPSRSRVNLDEVDQEYANSKRALLLWTSVRAQSLAFRGNVFVHATNPGRVDTSLRRWLVPVWRWWLFKPVRFLTMRRPVEGALAAVRAGLAPEAVTVFGRYCEDSQQLEDLVLERMPEKRLAVLLVKWATRLSQLEARVVSRSVRASAVDARLRDRARATA